MERIRLSDKKKPLIIIAGPTAAGKTKTSILLAKKVDGEIISADSMQVYRYMDIGSAKVTPEEMQGVPHHLIDVLEPTEEFNVVRFQTMAKAAMEDIYARGRVPILVGGTGFYIQSILYDIDFTENEADTAYRHELEHLAKEQGSEALYRMLMEADPEAAKELHPNNIKRVIRALEYHRLTGQKISDHNREQRQKSSPYEAYYFVLTMDRAKLYQRIDLRVDLMLEQGLVEEVRKLKEMGLTKNDISMQGLGYKEILAFLDGESTLEEAIYTIKRDTRHFAKRQLTWFRREPEAIWIDCDPDQRTAEDIVSELLKYISGRGEI
ncbi:MAG: tRNA (adenosine(37)-N6)-dimethylallyltransferase MiaA [Lachnospiraceae bacterium]|nr:tRNA (adenosine(37)-N6)-dimethylallyltransferase MiaA [Lachnospiraceae bacterium]